MNAQNDKISASAPIIIATSARVSGLPSALRCDAEWKTSQEQSCR
jgi:hypothetical protein